MKRIKIILDFKQPSFTYIKYVQKKVLIKYEYDMKYETFSWLIFQYLPMRQRYKLKVTARH